MTGPTTENTPPEDATDKPWYRQFWPWFILLPPLAAIAAGIATLIIAHQGSDVPISSAVERRGLLRLENPDALAVARQRGITAQIECRQPCRIVLVTLDRDEVAGVKDATLQVDLFHALDPERDLSVALLPQQPGVYGADLSQLIDGHYRVLLRAQSGAGEWMLRGHFETRAGPGMLSADG